MPTLCLNMIVKDESHVIERCLSLVKDHIDYWVIVDTGSTDGTQDIIRTTLKGIPGELHERPWIDFAYNRNEAISLARSKADYIFIVDADEKFIFSKEFDKSKWDQDFYLIKGIGEFADFYHPNIVSNDPSWEWKGALHEYITSSKKMAGQILLTVKNERVQDGSRSKDPLKQQKIAEGLLKAMEREPENSRHVFYLAQTYACMQEFEPALKYYEQRSTMEGDRDETYWTWYRMGCVRELLGKDFRLIVETFCKAFELCPQRAEPVERLANYFGHHNCLALCYLISHYGKTMKQPIALNSDFYPWVYDYALLSIHADSAFYIGSYEEAYKSYSQLLMKKKTPDQLKEHIQSRVGITHRRLEREELAKRRGEILYKEWNV